MKATFHPDAEVELEKSILYYENVREGLGFDFAIEPNLTIERVILYPEAWPEIEKDIRRNLLNRFPYGVLYHI